MRLRSVALGFSFVVLVSACAAEATRFGPSVECDTTSRGRLLLFAQAVPTAEMIPCLGDLGPAWEIREIETRSDEAVIHVSDDATDVEAEVRFLGACESYSADAAETGIALLRDQGPDQDQVFVFAGGCVLVSFEEKVGRQVVDELLGAIRFLTRDDLRSLSGWEL